MLLLPKMPNHGNTRPGGILRSVINHVTFSTFRLGGDLSSPGCASVHSCLGGDLPRKDIPAELEHPAGTVVFCQTCD